MSHPLRQQLEDQLDRVYVLETMFDQTVVWTQEIRQAYHTLQETKTLLRSQILSLTSWEEEEEKSLTRPVILLMPEELENIIEGLF